MSAIDELLWFLRGLIAIVLCGFILQLVEMHDNSTHTEPQQKCAKE